MLCVLIMFCSLITIAGVAVIPFAMNHQTISERFDPTLSFEDIAGGCEILSVVHETLSTAAVSTHGTSTEICIDRYVYTFSVGSADTHRSYMSEAEDQQRGSRNCRGPPLASGHSVGDRVQCWIPRNGTNPTALHDLYTWCESRRTRHWDLPHRHATRTRHSEARRLASRHRWVLPLCLWNSGNDRCYKLQDPASEHGFSARASHALWLAGVVIIPIGLLCTCAFIVGYVKMKTPPSSEERSLAQSKAETFMYGTSVRT